MKKIFLYEDKQLIDIVLNHDKHPDGMVVMAMELLEYRMSYGPLGCAWLDAESECFTKMKP